MTAVLAPTDPLTTDDLPIDVDPRSGRLLSVAELRRALQLVRAGLPAAVQPGPAGPLAGREVWDGEPGLPLAAVDDPAAAGWVVGASGGSGESLLAGLLGAGSTDRYVPTGHHWPAAAGGARVVLCARTNMRSLTHAQQALGQWAAGRLPGVDLVGMVLLADAPGKEPRPIQQFAQVLAGGVPRQWQIPWIGQWRLGSPEPAAIPKPVQTVLAEIRSAITTPKLIHLRKDEGTWCTPSSATFPRS